MFRGTLIAPRALAILLGSAVVLLAQTAPGAWTIDTSRSRLIIHVLPAGLLSSALHPHHFQPDTWGGEVLWDAQRPGSVQVEVRVDAGSLRDHQPKLSAKDLAKVEGQARGPEILDAAKFPSILFQARGLELEKTPSDAGGEFRGTLAGTLTLHGKELPLQFPIEGQVSADRFTARATAKFKQSEFGIKPYSTGLGTIAVRDEITVEISLVGIPSH